jgi:hypothetical protein
LQQGEDHNLLWSRLFGNPHADDAVVIGHGRPGVKVGATLPGLSTSPMVGGGRRPLSRATINLYLSAVVQAHHSADRASGRPAWPSCG